MNSNQCRLLTKWLLMVVCFQDVKEKESLTLCNRSWTTVLWDEGKVLFIFVILSVYATDRRLILITMSIWLSVYMSVCFLENLYGIFHQVHCFLVIYKQWKYNLHTLIITNITTSKKKKMTTAVAVKACLHMCSSLSEER